MTNKETDAQVNEKKLAEPELKDEGCLYIEDNGDINKMTILFTFDSDDYGKQYVVYQDPQGDPDEVFASIYTDEGELLPIDDDEEWKMVEEVIHTFCSDEEEA